MQEIQEMQTPYNEALPANAKMQNMQEMHNPQNEALPVNAGNAENAEPVK